MEDTQGGLDVNWLQITSQRGVTAATFANGIQDYNWSVGGNWALNMAKSYFRIGVRMVGPVAGGPIAPVLADDIAFADSVCDNLFDNCYFKAGGSDVSSIVNYSGTAGMLKKRVTKSGAWMRSIGADAYGTEASFTERLNGTASNGTGARGTQTVPGQSTKYVMWQPPIGIFDYDGLLGSGSYKLQLNPRQNYKLSAAESAGAQVAVTDFDFFVDSIEFYVCLEKSNIPPTLTEKLYLTECQIQTKTISGGNPNLLDFTVPPSTKQIAVFVADPTYGNDTRFPLTRFKTTGDTDQRLEQIQITYANNSKPSTNWSSDFATPTNYMIQRYYDTQMASGLLFSEGGCETFSDWLERGGVYLFDFDRDSSDRSTHVQLQIKYQGITNNSNVFIAAFYNRAVQITTTDGFVSSVESLSI